MERLVYSPKIYAYVQTSDHHSIIDGEFAVDDKAFDLSEYIVSGSVTRRVDQPSTAELVLRNPDRMFTPPGKPKFHPMDKITIFMQRLPGHSVQVFTGYLDKTPYYQMYPGTCTLSATCTLKRLLYNYFDPALPFMTSFMREYGWIVDSQNGQLISPPQNNTDPAAASTPSSTGSQTTTGNQGQRTWAQAVTQPTDKKLLIIGDSIGVRTDAALTRKLKNKGWTVTPESTSVVSRPLGAWSAGEGGVAVMRRLHREGKIPQTILIQLGTNDLGSSSSQFAQNVQEILDIADGRTVYWPNLMIDKASGLSTEETAQMIARLNTVLNDKAAANSNLHIIDYKNAVDNGSITLEDGIHPTMSPGGGGAAKRAALIFNTIQTGGGGGTSGTPSVSSQELAQKDIDAFNAAAKRDGSVAKLLYAVLKHIGNWEEEEIWIEKLPEGLLKGMSGIFSELTMENASIRDQLEQFLHGIVGSSSQGGGSTTNGDLSSGTVAGEDKIIPILIEAAHRFNLDPTFVINAGIQESGLNPGILETASSQGAAQGDYGLFQQATYPAANFDPYPFPAMHKVGFGRDKSPPKYWTKTQATDPGLNSNLFCAATRYYVDNHPGSFARGNWAQLTQAVQGSVGYPAWDSTMGRAEALYSKYKDQGTAANLDPNSNLGTLPNSTEKIYAPIAGGGIKIGSPYGEPNHGNPPHTHMGIDVQVPAGTACIAPCDGKISGVWATGFGNEGGMIHFQFTHNVGDIKAGTVIGWGHAVGAKFKTGDSVKGGQVVGYTNYNSAPHCHFIVRRDSTDLDGIPGMDPTSLFKALQKGETASTGGGTNDSNSASASATTDSGSANGVAGALATVFDLPGITQTLEAYLLPPDRSLMNDQPLLPFIEQLSKGSLRSFQSMPNGNFYGFFPDYFGSFGKQPYWAISDIEVLDGKIELTDKNLATHVFVVGDTYNLSPQTDFINELATAGVVSIMNAGSTNFIKRNDTKIDHPASDKNPSVDTTTSEQDIFLGNLEVSLAFLRRYGARPYREDIPMLRSHYFELFVAFQTFMLMWSRQFLTTFTFTFMPEIYPGGLVAFERHGLQCYVEEVTHTFDYSTGFTTQANLTAAAALPNTPDVGYSDGLVKAGILGTGPQPDTGTVVKSGSTKGGD